MIHSSTHIHCVGVQYSFDFVCKAACVKVCNNYLHVLFTAKLPLELPVKNLKRKTSVRIGVKTKKPFCFN